MVHPELKNIVEAALLVASEPLTVDKILSLFNEESRPAREEVLAALQSLQEECAARGVELRQIGRGYRYQTRERYAQWVGRLLEERPPRYSRALLETLAIIVYRQPVTRGEIEEIRGVAVSTEIIKTLVGRDWIRQVGQREVPGRPALYSTTRGFLEYFNLKSLDELPPLAEVRDIEKLAARLNGALMDGNEQEPDQEQSQRQGMEEHTANGHAGNGESLENDPAHRAVDAAGGDYRAPSSVHE